eukprot:COSAG03_NODE_928_length_5279_cov_42.043243_2_plen_78_part_00
MAGLLGVLATLNLTTSSGVVWCKSGMHACICVQLICRNPLTHWLLVWMWVCTALLGSEVSYHDCSSFTDEQLSGVRK